MVTHLSEAMIGIATIGAIGIGKGTAIQSVQGQFCDRCEIGGSANVQIIVCCRRTATQLSLVSHDSGFYLSQEYRIC